MLHWPNFSHRAIPRDWMVSSNCVHYLSASVGLSMMSRIQQMLDKLVSKLFSLVPYLRFNDHLELMSQRRVEGWAYAYLELFLGMVTHCRSIHILYTAI